MASEISGPDTKPRYESPKGEDFKPEACDSGGKYQELEKLGDFCEVTAGSRVQRLNERNYCKTDHEEKKKSGIQEIVDSLVKDTRGPPYENRSVPKRIL